MGFRGISRVTGVAHTTIINWVKQERKLSSDTYEAEDTPKVGEVDELQTFIGKKTKFGFGQGVFHFRSGILCWVVGDRSSKTFIILWQAIAYWECYLVGMKIVYLARLTARRIEEENTRSLVLLDNTSSSNLMLLQILRYN